MERNTSSQDKLLADIARIIITAYNGSYKPHLMKFTDEYSIYHIPEGYVLTDSPNVEKAKTVISDKCISDFIRHVFLAVGNISNINPKDIAMSRAVGYALNKYFGLHVYINMHDIYHPFSYSNTIIYQNKPWNEHMKAVLKDKGFEYFDRDFWIIYL